MTTSAQDTALAQSVVRTAYFAELQFRTATQYLCSWNSTITWGGHDWLGLGQLGDIGQINESNSLDAQSLDLVLNCAQLSWVALAVGEVEEYRGLPAKLYFCPLDSGYGLIDTPIQCWRGTMDVMTMGIDNNTGKIVLRCENSAFGLKKNPALRVNAAQHKLKYPNDTGLDYMTDLIANPQIWLSKKFQSQ